MTSGPEYDFLEQPESVEVADTPPEPVAETVVTPETPAPVAPTATDPPEERVPLAALKAEREKRQQREAKLAEYERELAQLRQPAQPQPDFYEQPQQYIQTIIQQERQQMSQALMGALEEQARVVFNDYDEVIADVTEAAQGNPMIVQQVMASANPALAAYKLGKQLRELKNMQDPQAYRQRIEAEVRAQIAKEQADKESARANAAQAIPPDLSAARASKGDEVAPDDSLDSILASRKR